MISKVLTARMGKFMNSIICNNQAAFVPGLVIHNHKGIIEMVEPLDA